MIARSISAPIVAIICSSCPGHACIPLGLGQSNFRIQLLSAPVNVAPDCSFVNGGVFDNIRFTPANDLGQGRVYQTYVGWEDEALVVDCNSREAIILVGPIEPDVITNCGDWVSSPLIGPDGVVTLQEGSNLHELAAHVRSLGGGFRDPNRELNETPWGEPVWRRDRVNLLCGCNIFYPDSPGAAQ
jgi:hypothetical protein